MAKNIQRKKLIDSLFNSYIYEFDNTASENLAYNLDYNQLSKDLRDYFYQPGYLAVLQRIVDYILKNNITNPYSSVSERVRHWLSNISVISKGAYGQAFKTGILEHNEFFAIKTPLKGEDITHEYGVGLILNRLRDEELTPNFVYTFGQVSCTRPIVGSDNPIEYNKVQTWCHDGADPTNYIIIENIPNSNTLVSALRDLRGSERLTPQQIISSLLQIFFAIWIANNETKFTHWDLHLNNILLRKVEEDSVIKYNVEGEEYLINTLGYVATIIDFGLSSIEVPGTNGLKEINLKSGKHRGYSNPYQDIYTSYINIYFEILELDILDTDMDDVINTVYNIIEYILAKRAPNILKRINNWIPGVGQWQEARNLLFAVLPIIDDPMNLLFNIVVNEFASIIPLESMLLDPAYTEPIRILKCKNNRIVCPSIDNIVSKLNQNSVVSLEQVCLEHTSIMDEETNISVYNDLELRIKSRLNTIYEHTIKMNNYSSINNTIDDISIIDPLQSIGYSAVVTKMFNDIEQFLTSLIETWVSFNELAYYSRVVECADTLPKYKNTWINELNRIEIMYNIKLEQYLLDMTNMLWNFEQSKNNYTNVINIESYPLIYNHMKNIINTLSVPIHFA